MWWGAAAAIAVLAATQRVDADSLSSAVVPATPTPSLVAQLPNPQAPTVLAPAGPAPACTGPVDPYKNYACLDAYLGDDVLTRLYNYYRLEWGESGPPTDPNAPPGRIEGWPRTPQSTPPMPFTEWPYGGTTSLGVTRTGSADSPLMVAISNTPVGQWLNETGIQIYGWVNPASTSAVIACVRQATRR
jgi:hypothetical protein